jgi:hypothetical protein
MSFVTNKNNQNQSEIKVKNAEVCAIVGFFANAAIQAHTTVTIAIVKGTSNQPKVIFSKSKLLKNDFFVISIATYIVIHRKISHAINAGSIKSCKLLDIAGIKNLITQITKFIVIAKARIGVVMLGFLIGSSLYSCASGVLFRLKNFTNNTTINTICSNPNPIITAKKK